MQAAVEALRSRRPDMAVRGPVTPEEASRCDPNVPGGGSGTVLVFPDQLSAEVTFKAARRASGVRILGPVLQGLRRPVNIAARDAGVLDLVELIVATAVQASRNV